MTMTTKILRSVCQAALLLLCLTAAGPGYTGEQEAVQNKLDETGSQCSFQNPGFAQFTAMVSSRSTPTRKLVSAPVSLEGFSFSGLRDGKLSTMSLIDYLEGTHTDALLVLHNGKLVFERYYNGMAPYQR